MCVLCFVCDRCALCTHVCLTAARRLRSHRRTTLRLRRRRLARRLVRMSVLLLLLLLQT
jgi:hypothetical protein